MLPGFFSILLSLLVPEKFKKIQRDNAYIIIKELVSLIRLLFVNFYELSVDEFTKQIQPGDGANFTKEIAVTSEGNMTGQKRKNVSP
jgi:hypothetical protein